MRKLWHKITWNTEKYSQFTFTISYLLSWNTYQGFWDRDLIQVLAEWILNSSWFYMNPVFSPPYSGCSMMLLDLTFFLHICFCFLFWVSVFFCNSQKITLLLIKHSQGFVPICFFPNVFVLNSQNKWQLMFKIFFKYLQHNLKQCWSIGKHVFSSKCKVHVFF